MAGNLNLSGLEGGRVSTKTAGRQISQEESKGKILRLYSEKTTSE